MHDQVEQDPNDTKVNKPTEWEQRRRVVQRIMDKLTVSLDRSVSLRTLDAIGVRVAHQAFAGGPPEAFWPPMRALLDQCGPEWGRLVCEPLARDPAYDLLWEPRVRERSHDRRRGDHGPCWECGVDTTEQWVEGDDSLWACAAHHGPCWICGAPTTEQCDYQEPPGPIRRPHM